GGGNGAALGISDFHGDEGDVSAIGREGVAVRFEGDGGGWAGGFDGGLESLAVARAFGEEFAGCVVHFPLEVAVGVHGLRAQGNAVEEEFDGVAVAVNPDGNFLALAARPVPMRKELQNGTSAPPGLVVVEGVLGKTAGVHNAELRADGGPRKGIRLAA